MEVGPNRAHRRAGIAGEGSPLATTGAPQRARPRLFKQGGALPEPTVAGRAWCPLEAEQTCKNLFKPKKQLHMRCLSGRSLILDGSLPRRHPRRCLSGDGTARRGWHRERPGAAGAIRARSRSGLIRDRGESPRPGAGRPLGRAVHGGVRHPGGLTSRTGGSTTVATRSSRRSPITSRGSA
jgi:hypothetical protein